MLYDDRNRRSGRKPHLLRPVTLQVKVGAAAVTGDDAGAAALVPDDDISDL